MEFYLIGYSGHAFVVTESALGTGMKPVGYFETDEKALNPYQIEFMGSEDLIKKITDIQNKSLFIGIGNNKLRNTIYNKLNTYDFCNIIDKSANLSFTSELKTAIYVGKNVIVNALCKIGQGVILNTNTVIEHECIIGDFSHIAPGAVLCGNVSVGRNTFIGANSVVKEGMKIGDNVTIGAGSVVVKPVESGSVYVGNPLRKIR